MFRGRSGGTSRRKMHCHPQTNVVSHAWVLQSSTIYWFFCTPILPRPRVGLCLSELSPLTLLRVGIMWTNSKSWFGLPWDKPRGLTWARPASGCSQNTKMQEFESQTKTTMRAHRWHHYEVTLFSEACDGLRRRSGDPFCVSYWRGYCQYGPRISIVLCWLDQTVTKATDNNHLRCTIANNFFVKFVWHTNRAS